MTALGGGHAATVDPRVAEFRGLASTNVGDALDAARRAVNEEHDPDPALLYLVAELLSRSGQPHESLDYIDRAQAAFRRGGQQVAAERCEIGRSSVLDDLGRLDDAIAAASRQLDRLRRMERTADVIDLEVRALVNRGASRESLAAYREALDDYDLALASADVLGDATLGALVQINRANVLDLLGKTSAALEGLYAADRLLRDTGDRDDWVKVLINIAAILCRRGEFDAGLGYFQQAEEVVEPRTVDECTIAVETAEALAAMGGVADAAARYRGALETLASTPLSWLEGRAWLGLGLCAARLGEIDEARQALRCAYDAFCAADNLPSQVTTLLEIAAIESDDPSTRELALGSARRALALADPERWPVQACLAHVRLADMLVGAEAERHLRVARRLAAPMNLAPLSMRIEQRLGSLLLLQRRPRDAKPHVTEAVRLAEQLRTRLRHGSLLRSFPTETASCYEDLVDVLLAEGDLGAASEAADRARGRSLTDMGSVVLGVDPDNPEVRELEAELHAVYDRVLGVEERVDAVVRRELEVHATELEERLDRLSFRLRPVARPAGQGGVAPVGRRRDAGPEVDLALTYRERGGRYSLFVEQPGREPRYFSNIADVAAVERAMTRFHADGRRAHALSAAGLAVPDSISHQAARRLGDLGRALLGPIVDIVAGSSASRPLRVALAPVGALHRVPFAALGVDTKTLLDRAVVSVAPSHSTRRLCNATDVASGPVIVVGVTEGAIPGVEIEVRRIAALLGDRSEAAVHLLMDDAATLDTVRGLMPRASLVHLASHGIFRPSAPLRSGVRLFDGWLTARHVGSADLRGSCVVLSACDTGRSHVADGEEVLGLQYGFLAAGARHVVMSLWPAHDESTVDLMVDFHAARRSGHTVPDSLRMAQLSARDAGRSAWWWGAFVCAGGDS